MCNCKVSPEPLLLLGNLVAHDLQQRLHFLVKLEDVALEHLFHLLAQLEVAGGDHAADQRGEAQRYAGLCQHPVFDLDRVAQPGPSNIEHPRRRMHRVSSL